MGETNPTQVPVVFSSYSGFELEAGCDEAGRGCLAGPVVAAAVILKHGRAPKNISDSKKLTAPQREEAAKWIRGHAIAWSVGVMSPSDIDKYNILWASVKAMNTAVEKLQPTPQFILVDGNKFRTDLDIPFSCIVKGDGLIPSISAASILAKTTRDKIMEELHEEYPAYDWKTNKGYPTEHHRRAVFEHGKTPWHRKTFTIRPPAGLRLFEKGE